MGENWSDRTQSLNAPVAYTGQHSKHAGAVYTPSSGCQHGPVSRINSMFPVQGLPPGLTVGKGRRDGSQEQQTGYPRPTDITVTSQVNETLVERVSLTINKKNTGLFPN